MASNSMYTNTAHAKPSSVERHTSVCLLLHFSLQGAGPSFINIAQEQCSRHSGAYIRALKLHDSYRIVPGSHIKNDRGAQVLQGFLDACWVASLSGANNLPPLLADRTTYPVGFGPKVLNDLGRGHTRCCSNK